MTEDFGREIGSKIGKVLEVDKRAIQADQAKFLRIRVEVQLDKPRWRGGFVKNDENETDRKASCRERVFNWV